MASLPAFSSSTLVLWASAAFPPFNFVTAALTSSREGGAPSMGGLVSTAYKQLIWSFPFGGSSVYNCSNYSAYLALCSSMTDTRQPSTLQTALSCEAGLEQSFFTVWWADRRSLAFKWPSTVRLLTYLSLFLLMRALVLRDRYVYWSCFLVSLADRFSSILSNVSPEAKPPFKSTPFQLQEFHAFRYPATLQG